MTAPNTAHRPAARVALASSRAGTVDNRRRVSSRAAGSRGRAVGAVTLAVAFVAVGFGATGCQAPAPPPLDPPAQSDGERPAREAAAPAMPAHPAVKTDKGVDIATRTIRVGALNDETGAAAVIGKPFALGKRIVAATVNAGGSGLLPEGWRLELVERDHQYSPQKSVQAYNEIAGDVLFIATSFGTPNTLPLRPMLQRDGLIAFPASLSSKMGEHNNTPPLGASYEIEARRALDWAVDAAGGSAGVKAAIIYQQDDYGQDGLRGWRAAAARHKVEVVSAQAVSPTQKDFTAVVSAVKEAGATHVLLTVLPGATGPILSTAAGLGFAPTWIGNTPSWIDAFFDKLPAPLVANFYWVTSLAFWGEDTRGMMQFLAAWERYGEDRGAPDFYVLNSYAQGLVMVEAARLAIASGDITRAGFEAALHGIQGFDAGGLTRPLDLTHVPYVTGRSTRILRPDMPRRTWREVAPYAAPKD